MTDLIVIEEFRAYLVAQGAVRNWGTSGNGLPQCILDPRDGAPEAGAQAGTNVIAGGKGASDAANYEAAVITLTRTGLTPQRPLEEFQEDAHVECIVRAYRSPDAELIQRRVRASIDGLKLFTMGALIVEWARVFTGDQPLGSDETSYSRMQTFMIRSRVKSLAGLPYGS